MKAKRFAFNQEKLMSIVKGGCIAMLGALLTYLTKIISGSESFGEWTPIIVAGWSMLVNVLKKYVEVK